jgi:hypothetical protein
MHTHDNMNKQQISPFLWEDRCDCKTVITATINLKTRTDISSKFQVVVSCTVTPCSDVVGYRRFGGQCCLHLQSGMEWSGCIALDYLSQPAWSWWPDSTYNGDKLTDYRYGTASLSGREIREVQECYVSCTFDASWLWPLFPHTSP